MEFKDTPYYKVGRASDLRGLDRFIYRLLEIFVPLLSWGTLIGAIVLSYVLPVWAALLVIALDLYWLFKTSYLSIHLRQNWKRMRNHLATPWEEKLKGLPYEDLYQMVILPFYKESDEVIEKSIEGLLLSKWDKRKMIVVLAAEKRAGDKSLLQGEYFREKYESRFFDFILTVHPDNISGEMPGKGSNISFAAEEARREILDKKGIAYRNVLVSAFDIDTIPYGSYFLCLAWYFLTVPKPLRSSFQPVPVYNNNIWDAPAFSRVVAVSSTFWQMVQQERPEKLATFSSHALNFQTLYEIGYWQKNIVSEDSRIFWNALLAFNGDYRVVPISYPVSMDANLAPTFFETMKNVYRQQRRWTWGVENVPYILFGFLKNRRIPFLKKISFALVQIEGFWSLATNPILIFVLGWLPLLVGGGAFKSTLLFYNLPLITRDIMLLAMIGLIISAIISWQLLPPKPTPYTWLDRLFMTIQWILVPFTLVFFGSIPGLDAQTRLIVKKYLGFWVTPKYQKKA